MVFQDMIENPTHKIFIIVHNTPSINNSTNLNNLYKFKNETQISFERSIFSIIKEMLLEFQRIVVDLYSPNDKFLHIMASDSEINQENFEWKTENCMYNNFVKVIENLKIMQGIEKENMTNLLYKSIEQTIPLLGKITPEQMKLIELFYNGQSNSSKKKISTRWWDTELINYTDDKDDKKFSFFSNLGTLILIVHNFTEDDIKNVFERISNNVLDHRKKVHGVHRLESVHFKIINIVDEVIPLFKKYYTEDRKSNVYLDRYDIHLDENSKTTIGFLLREIFNLSSFTMTNIPMKDESNSKLNLNVEMYHPKVDLPFLNVKKFQESMNTIVLSTDEYECVKMFTNIKSKKSLVTFTAAWNSTPKRTPLLSQSLPFTVSDFSSREGSCANGFILGGKDIFPELLLKDLPLKGSDLAFSLSKNIDNSKGQICIIDEALYESKNANESGGKNLADKKIMDKMFDFIDLCTSNIEKTNFPSLKIDTDLRNARTINPTDNLPCSIETKECFRSELNKFIKILSRVDSIDSTYAYFKAMIESKKRSKDEMKCILDVISNFRCISKNHEDLYEGFCYYYFNGYILNSMPKNFEKFSTVKNIKGRNLIRSTNKNVIEKLIKRYEDTKPEFSAWSNGENEGKTIIPLYQFLNIPDTEERFPFQSKYVAPDRDEILLAEYSKCAQPLSDDYLKIAPPPYFGGGIIPAAYEKQRMEYKGYVNLLTNGALSKEMKLEIEKKCEKLRLNYSEPLPPLVSSSAQQLDTRKRRYIGDWNDRTHKIHRHYTVPSRAVVALTKQESQMAEKLNKEYRESLKGKIIDVDLYEKEIKRIEGMMVREETIENAT